MVLALALTSWLGITFMLSFIVVSDLHQDGGIRVDGAAIFLVVLLSLAWPFILPVAFVAASRRRRR